MFQKIPSYDYIVNVKHAEITFVQGDLDYYVISQKNLEITNTNNKDDSNLIFGEDAVTEDNILKHYIFKSNK